MNSLQADKSNESKKDGKDVRYYAQPKVRYQEYIASASLCKEPAATFLGAMKWTILIGQVFGLNPVLGVCEKDASKVSFYFYSGRCLYSLASVFGQSTLMVLCTMKIFSDPSSGISSNTAVMFYLCNGLLTAIFFGIAMKWPLLCREIAKIEAIDPCVDARLAMRCNITCILVMVFGTLEHTLADLSGMALATACHPNSDGYQAYLIQNFDWIWSVIPYNICLGIVFKFLNVQCTFNWNYSDAFIMCICWYLTSRLEQINDRITAVKGQAVPSSFWRTMREDYTKATTLVRKVDGVVSGVIFVSFASNLFSICFLLLHVLEEGLKPSMACNISGKAKTFSVYVHAAYYAFSIVFIIVRSLAVSLIAARVHSTSAKPAFILYEVPSAGYCDEVQRFLDQVHGDSVEMSGLQFFGVKRGMVLTIAATIVTYELVLIQFAGVTPTVAANTLLVQY